MVYASTTVPANTSSAHVSPIMTFAIIAHHVSVTVSASGTHVSACNVRPYYVTHYKYCSSLSVRRILVSNATFRMNDSNVPLQRSPASVRYYYCYIMVLATPCKIINMFVSERLIHRVSHEYTSCMPNYTVRPISDSMNSPAECSSYHHWWGR